MNELSLCENLPIYSLRPTYELCTFLEDTIKVKCVFRLHTAGPNPSNLVGTSTRAHTFYGGSFGERTASSEGSGRWYRAGMGRRRIVLILNLRIRRAAGEFHRGECRDGRETQARTLTRSLDVSFGGVRAADQDKYRNPRRENQRGKIQS